MESHFFYQAQGIKMKIEEGKEKSTFQACHNLFREGLTRLDRHITKL